MDEPDKRHGLVNQILPGAWNTGPARVASEMREMLKGIQDHGTEISSGDADGYADLLVYVGGKRYLIEVTECGPQHMEAE